MFHLEWIWFGFQIWDLEAGVLEDKSSHIYFGYKNMEAYIERDMEATYPSCE